MSLLSRRLDGPQPVPPVNQLVGVRAAADDDRRAVAGPGGRPAWLRTPGAARYCVVCPAAGLDYLDDYRTWVAAAEAAALVDGIVGGLTRPGC